MGRLDHSECSQGELDFELRMSDSRTYTNLRTIEAVHYFYSSEDLID